MRIINKVNRRETTLGSAVSIVLDCDVATGRSLRDMVVRLLEELTREDDGGPVLRHAQLERVLAYQFNVAED